MAASGPAVTVSNEIRRERPNWVEPQSKGDDRGRAEAGPAFILVYAAAQWRRFGRKLRSRISSSTVRLSSSSRLTSMPPA